MTWQPTSNLAILQARAKLLEATRLFFKEREVLEVDTPILGQAPVTDPYLSALQTKASAFPGKTFYLQTSPEYYLKRLLATYPISCYQIGKCFRDDEYGRYHSPEFLMLEYYRIGFDDMMLMQEVSDLLQTLTSLVIPAQAGIQDKFFGTRLSYREAFQNILNIDPHHTPLETLQAKVKTFYDGAVDRDTALQLLMSERIEPELAKIDSPVFIYDFPASQAALAKIKTLKDGTKVAARFEVYWRGVELGNAYHELINVEEQKARFDKDIAKRKAMGFTEVPIDQNLIAALENGLPDCAGIALGLDRMMMVVLGQDSLSKVQSFFEL